MMKYANKIAVEYADPEKWRTAFVEQKAWEGMKAARKEAKWTVGLAAAVTGTRPGLIREMEAGDVIPAYDMYEAYMEKIAGGEEEDGQGEV